MRERRRRAQAAQVSFRAAVAGKAWRLAWRGDLIAGVPTAATESPEHLRLKRLALVWAQAAGYPVAAAEVSIPEYQFRVDAAAYRPAREIETRVDSATGKRRRVSVASLGVTAIFECKVSRPDYLRDAGSIAKTRDRLAVLGVRRQRHEAILHTHYPSIRNGDSLFPEYETLDFDRPGYEAYNRVMKEVRRLSARLHAQTKFDRLTQWRAANVHFLVAEPELFEPHELPADWGLLLRNGDGLELVTRPVLHQAQAAQRLLLLHRIALAGTRAANLRMGISFEDVESARRGGGFGVKV
jgi:hypothetical protein